MGVTADVFLRRPASAQATNLYPLVDDQGQPLANFKVPSELSPFKLPGVVWRGASNPSVILIEFFDYNCPYCRKGVGELDGMLAANGELRLGLVNNAILSLGSFLAARVQQSVLRLYGPESAYSFHKQLFARHGIIDGLAALDAAKAMGLDATAIEKSADEQVVGDVLARQVKLAANLGFNATPSFVLNDVGVLGYPGAKSLRDMISAIAKCDRPFCKS